MTTRLLVCHVAEQNFSPSGPIFRISIAPLIVLVAGLRMGKFDQSHEELALYAVGALNLFCYLHMVRSVTNDVTSVLGIEVFRVKAKS